MTVGVVGGTCLPSTRLTYVYNTWGELPISWLRVFLSAGASRIGHRRRQQQHTRVAGVRKMRRTPAHSLAQNGGDRRVFWLRYACCTVRAWSSFLPLLQEVDATCKTRNQLYRLLGQQREIRTTTRQGLHREKRRPRVPQRDHSRR